MNSRYYLTFKSTFQSEKPKKLEKTSLNDNFFDWDYLHLTALIKETYFSCFNSWYFCHYFDFSTIINDIKICCQNSLSFWIFWIGYVYGFYKGEETEWNCCVLNFTKKQPKLISALLQYTVARTTDTQWQHKSNISEKLGRYGRQNMLPPYLKIWEWEWIFGRAVNAISSLSVRSPCLDLSFS